MCPNIKRKVGILFTGGPHSVKETMEIVRLAEASGFDSAWAADDIGGRDPFIRLASWATVTKRLRLGVAVTNPYTRHPVSLAAIAATLDEASSGRAVLGLGTGDSWKDFIRDQQRKQLEMMAEIMNMLRDTWSKPEATYEGKRVSLRTSLWVWPDALDASFRQDIPIYIGAIGPKMTSLAGRIADGLIIEMSQFISDAENQATLFWDNARQAGRLLHTLDVAPLIKVSIVEREEQLTVIRRIVAFEVARLPEATAEQQDFEMDPFIKIKSIYADYIARGSPLEHGNESAGHLAAPYVTQTMLDALAITGDMNRCLASLARYDRPGITLPLLIPLGCDPNQVVELGRRYLTQEIPQ